jgi:hypothetical protein
MSVTWNDLNNVQEPGDYPFRDGIIAVTFAEILIWKRNPGAQFQLMRKHPVRNEVTYVLGREIKETPTPTETAFIYESSNGDTWSLARNPATGAHAVMHRPNVQSGGEISYTEIASFLSIANGPEQQALRRLLETSPRAATILITCDIHPPKDTAYADLTKAVQSLGAWWHHLETVWIVKSVHTPAEIRDQLKVHLGTEDQLLVIDVSGDSAGWAGVNDVGSKWLDENI